MIKVKLDGRPQDRWIAWARWWWITNHGPVPDGHRVVYLDGDTMNDDPENIGVVTPGDVIFIAAERDPEMLDRNRRACSEATARSNSERGKKRRARQWLPTKWYAVFVDRRTVLNQPTKSRNGILRLFGVEVPRNGQVDLSGLPFVVMRGADLDACEYGEFRRVPKTSAADRAAVQRLFPARPVIAPNPSGLCQCGCGLTTPRATSHCHDVSLGQHRRFVAGHYHKLLRKKAESTVASEVRERCVDIATEVCREVAPHRWQECLGPAFEAALASYSRGRTSTKSISAAVRESIKKHFGSEYKRGVSIDALIAVGREPARNIRVHSFH